MTTSHRKHGQYGNFCEKLSMPAKYTVCMRKLDLHGDECPFKHMDGHKMIESHTVKIEIHVSKQIS